jgi:ribonucleoside-diphosphate reductase beta chain
MIDIDSASFSEVLAPIEEPTADARALYYRWEREQWEASVLDLARDASDWALLEADVRLALSSGLSCVFPPEDRLGTLLVPFVDAVESEEDQVFLTSQLVDQARAIVFAERVRSEIGIAIDPIPALDDLFEMVRSRAGDVRVSREQGEALYEGMLLHNVLYEGVIVASTIRSVGGYLDRTSMLPGLRSGLIAFARDLTRHVLFGIRLLQRGVVRDRGSNAGALEEIVENALPVLKSVLASSESAFGTLNEDENERGNAYGTLARRLQDVGIDIPT